MTGTPIGKGSVDDLYGLLVFLQARKTFVHHFFFLFFFRHLDLRILSKPVAPLVLCLVAFIDDVPVWNHPTIVGIRRFLASVGRPWDCATGMVVSCQLQVSGTFSFCVNIRFRVRFWVSYRGPQGCNSPRGGDP